MKGDEERKSRERVSLEIGLIRKKTKFDFDRLLVDLDIWLSYYGL